MTHEEKKQYNCDRMRKWRASLSPEERALVRARASELQFLRMHSSPALKDKHRARAKSYYWNRKAADPLWKPKRDRESINLWKRTQYENNPIYNITQKLRSRFSIALRQQGVTRKRRSSTRDLLGISFDKFQTYIESLWLPGMTWENHGHYVRDGVSQWHIDHIKPCAAFDLTDPEQQKICFHYTNMQPMWALDNFSKNSRWNGSIIRKYNLPVDRPELV